MPLNIVRDDLVNRREDAIVLPSNERLVIDGGAGLAVARAAGLSRVRRACRAIGSCPIGFAAVTPAFKLPAKCLIHAVGPMWQGTPEDAETLARTYRSALTAASEADCASAAIPLLSAGTFGCPAHVSLAIALASIRAFLAKSDLQVTLVLYDKAAVAASLDFLDDLECRIDDAYVTSQGQALPDRNRALAPMAGTPSLAPNAPAYGAGPPRMQTATDRKKKRWSRQDSGRAQAPMRDFRAFEDAMTSENAEPTAAPDFPHSPNLDERLESLDVGFSQTLLSLIDKSGMTDAQVYRRANMTRQHFSKIRSNVGYRPTKATVMALCVALELDIDTARDLLARAGFAISHASKFDVIVEYFIERGEYDPFKINETLFYFDQPLLG